jgi:putative heme-binding domain-containing protein
LPPERRAKRLGTAFDADELLAMEGDIDQGRELYFQSQDVTCRRCHTIGDQGTAVGPDLSSIGIERTRIEVLESILRPSAKIDPKYQSQAVVTVDGVVVSGLITHRDDRSVTIVEATGKPRTIANEEIESIRPMQKSSMPDLQLSEFTPQQAADLLAFLFAQKAPIRPAAGPASDD